MRTLAHDTTLYSAIPLPLSTHHISEHLHVLSLQDSDVLLLDSSDMPHTNFNFFNTSTPLFTSPTQKQGMAPPFTALLVGPLYTCRTILHTYFSWAHTDATTHSLDFNIKQRITPQSAMPSTPSLFSQNKRHTNKDIVQWTECKISDIWAQATFSTIEISCLMPTALQQEMSDFFNAPITVKAHPVHSSGSHNEYLAWLYAIYAMSAARTVGRTILSRSYSISPLYTLWYKDNEKNFEKIIPSSWKCILRHHIEKKKHLQKTIKILTQRKKQSITKEQVEKKSNYAIKSYLYTTSHSCNRIIGQATIKLPILCEPWIEMHGVEHCKLTVKRQSNHISIITPFLPSKNAIHAIENIVRDTLQTKIDTIQIEPTPEIIPDPYIHNSYAIIGTLTLQALRKLKPRTKTAVVTLSHSLTKTYSEASCVIEYAISPYGTKISLHNVYLSIDAGYIGQKTFLTGHIEKILYTTITSLFGIEAVSMKKNPTIYTTFVHKKNTVHTASISKLIEYAVRYATKDALKKYIPLIKKPLASFPSPTIFSLLGEENTTH